MAVFLPLMAGALNANWCPTSEQNRLNMYAQMLQAILNQSTDNVIISDTVPSAANQGKIWFENATSFNWYIFISGKWCRPHPIPPSDATGSFMCLWYGTKADIDTIDGGTAGAVTDFTGPFWQEVTDMQGRAAFGPNGSTIVEKLTGGEETHTLAITEMPAHSHNLTINGLNNGGGAAAIEGIECGAVNVNLPLQQSWVMADTGGGLPHQNMPPYRGIYYITRTARKYIVY